MKENQRAELAMRETHQHDGQGRTCGERRCFEGPRRRPASSHDPESAETAKMENDLLKKRPMSVAQKRRHATVGATDAAGAGPSQRFYKPKGESAELGIDALMDEETPRCFRRRARL
ncbi:MAG: hypothetical protein IPI95_16780 [Flavobacteriales bacterium]|nr:hypothetical protein [Flavobacteriales bacterium]